MKMVNSFKRPESRMAFGSNLVKPSELFGSVKRTINRKQSRCQCKHHQQRLLAKQEEQRQQLQEQLRQRGDNRKVAPKFKSKIIDWFINFTSIFSRFRFHKKIRDSSTFCFHFSIFQLARQRASWRDSWK